MSGIVRIQCDGISARASKITTESGEELRVTSIGLKIEEGIWVAEIEGFAKSLDLCAKVKSYRHRCIQCGRADGKELSNVHKKLAEAVRLMRAHGSIEDLDPSWQELIYSADSLLDRDQRVQANGWPSADGVADKPVEVS